MSVPSVIGSWPSAAVVLTAMLVLIVESGSIYGVLLPGTAAATVLGAWSIVGGHSTTGCMAAAAAATVTGAHIGWCRGTRGADLPAPITTVPKLAAAVDHARERLPRPLDHAGTAAVLVAMGHWASVLRPLVPRHLAACGVPYRRVGPALIVAGTSWGATMVAAGAWAGPTVLAHLGWAGPSTVTLVVVTVLLRSRRTHRSLGRATRVEGGAGSRTGTGSATSERPFVRR